MRLTKLEMYGFKSFARKTEIVFDDGITAIIGPNGSGKSNIADAVRWVLGEQSAKALRGEKMEDIIFNGTEAKKPLSYGEVSLTFDNSDHELATDYNEVCVTRRIYRSGESEYFINRSSCRRKDIAELFRDTGVGKEGYSIIGQGRVEQILSAKSADRRSAFEEAAGVMKYRVRKEEAARKLENTRSNMDRLSDIIEELSRQVGPLEEQSAAAREYLKLRDELKEIEINVFLYQYDKLNERIKTLNEAIASANEQIREKEGIEASIASSCSEEEELERALNSSISAVQSELLAMTTGVEGHAGESKVLSERMEAFVREKEQRQSQLEENEKRHADLLQALNCGKANIERTDEELEQLRCEAAVASGELQQLSKDVEQKEEKLEEQKAALIDAMNRIADARILISRFETMRQSLVEQAANMAKNKKQAEEKGLRIVDATCPYVKKIHQLVSDYSEKGYTIIVIGKAAHPEVMGIIGWASSDAYVVYDPVEIQNIPFDKEQYKFCVVAQTTADVSHFEDMARLITEKAPEALVFNTVCSATAQRQSAAEELASSADMMIVIGDKESSNTKRLYELCKKHCDNTFAVQSAADVINISEGIENIGIVAGASTPDWVIKEVIERMTEEQKIAEATEAVANEQVAENVAEEATMEDFEKSMVKLRNGQYVKLSLIHI